LGPFVTHVGATALAGFMFQCVMITGTNIPEVTSLNLGRIMVYRRHSVAFIFINHHPAKV
jgi:hypothetical protein